MSKEIWKNINGTDGAYSVSSIGNVISNGRMVVYSTGGIRFTKTTVLKQFITHGYPFVRLRIKKKYYNRRIHRLVAEHFLSPVTGKTDVNHKNAIKTDNRVENLEWCNQQENIEHSMKMGLWGSHVAKRGKDHHLSKPVEGIDKNGKVIHRFDCTVQGESYGFSNTGISAACRGILKTHKGLRWRYI